MLEMHVEEEVQPSIKKCVRVVSSSGNRIQVLIWLEKS